MNQFVKAGLVLAGSLLLVLSGCQPVGERSVGDKPAGPVYAASPDSSRAVYRLAIHPLHNPSKLVGTYQPLVDRLNASIPGVRFSMEASRDYQTYEVKFRSGEPDLLLPNPWQTLEAMKVGYRVIAMAGDPADFKGIFIMRKDGVIKSPRDLKGKVVSYPSPTALAACVMPQWYLHQQGLDVNRDIVNRYVGSQESSILNAYLGEAAVAATWPPPWRAFQKDHPKEAEQLKVIWETPPLLNNSFMVKETMPAVVVEQVRQVLLGLHETAEGRRILEGAETARFHPADNDTYKPVRQFVQRFEREVRPVERR